MKRYLCKVEYIKNGESKWQTFYSDELDIRKHQANYRRYGKIRELPIFKTRNISRVGGYYERKRKTF